MKNKLVWWLLICVLFVAVTSSSVFAPYEQVAKYGITNANQGWLTDTKGTSAYTLNWTDASQADNMPLVYDLDMDGVNEIIQSRSGTIKVYAPNGSVLATKIQTGLGNRQISAFNSTNCPNNQALYVTTLNSNILEMCFNGTALTDAYACTLNGVNVNIPDYIGIGMAYQGSSIVGLVYTGWVGNELGVCDFTGNNTAFYNVPDIYQIKGVPPTGNLFGDGYVWWVFSWSNSTNFGVRMVKYDSTSSIVTAPAEADSLTDPPIVIRRGSGNNDELLIPYSRNGYNPVYVHYKFWYGDSTGTQYAILGLDDWGYVNTTLSNPVQLGVNGDICWASFSPNFASSFFCYTPSTLSYSYSQGHGFTGVMTKLLAMDMNNDGNADFFFGSAYYLTNSNAYLCLFLNTTSALNCSIIGGVADYVYGVDADNDGSRDIIYSDSANDVFRVWLTGGAPQNITSCNDSDTASFPSISYYVQGTMNATGLYPVSDWCNGNQLYEYYCINATTPSLYPTPLDCGISGMICQNGACVTPPVNGTCVDSDNLSYPSVNFEVQGTAIANGTNTTQNQTDYCYSGDRLIEYYCTSPTSSSLWYANYSCSAFGKVCQDGACVAGQGSGYVCNDTDLQTFPTKNYYSYGIAELTYLGNHIWSYDNCLNSSTLQERYCTSPTNDTILTENFDCASVGGTCVAGECRVSNNSNCFDSDSNTYPTLSTTIAGTAMLYLNGNLSMVKVDNCTSDTTLLEAYCLNTNSSQIIQQSYNCAQNGKTCLAGACVNGTTLCPIYTDSYEYPVVWVETFGYIDSILNHGWSGYPFVVGNDPYSVCNVLFINRNISGNDISHTFPTTPTTDYTLRWDMHSVAYINDTNYVPNGMPLKVELRSSGGAPVISMEWTINGTIRADDGNGGWLVIGNWQDAMSSYKVIIHPQNYSYDFYYTNSTQSFGYALGGTGLPFSYNFTTTKMVFVPDYPLVPQPYKAIGIYVDNIVMTMGNLTPVSNQTSFCDFTGCIFKDHFNYSDDTYTHGWFDFNTTPVSSVVTYYYQNGYYFYHDLDTIHSTDNSGLFSLQFKANIPQPSQDALDWNFFELNSPDLESMIRLQFTDGVIVDVNRNGAVLGSYGYDAWNTYTMQVNMNSYTYDFYIGGNKVVSNAPITIPKTAINRIGFFVNTNSSIKLDFVAVAKGTILADYVSGGFDPETGVPVGDLTWCWSKTNGTFNWACCDAEENLTKSYWCPARVTARYYLANVTNFVLGNFIYFLILVIGFVILVPFIVPKKKVQ